jgi:hypothetical protein
MSLTEMVLRSRDASLSHGLNVSTASRAHGAGIGSRLHVEYQVMPSSYPDFLQRVRRHRPSDLLIALADTSIRLFEQEAWTADRVRLPWASAAAAKANIVAGNEHRRTGVTDKDVIQICQASGLNLDGSPRIRRIAR